MFILCQDSWNLKQCATECCCVDREVSYVVWFREWTGLKQLCGIWHRAFCVYVFSAKKEIWLWNKRFRSLAWKNLVLNEEFLRILQNMRPGLMRWCWRRNCVATQGWEDGSCMWGRLVGSPQGWERLVGTVQTAHKAERDWWERFKQPTRLRETGGNGSNGPQGWERQVGTVQTAHKAERDRWERFKQPTRLRETGGNGSNSPQGWERQVGTVQTALKADRDLWERFKQPSRLRETGGNGSNSPQGWERLVTPVPGRTFSRVVTLAWPDPAPGALAPFINNWCFHTACLLTGWPCCGKQLPSIWLVFLNCIVLTATLHVYSIRIMNEL